MYIHFVFGLRQEKRPNMYKLLGWEYYRIWKKEHDDYDGKRKRHESIKFIKPEIKKKAGQEKKTKDKSSPFIMKKLVLQCLSVFFYVIYLYTIYITLLIP